MRTMTKNSILIVFFIFIFWFVCFTPNVVVVKRKERRKDGESKTREQNLDLPFVNTYIYSAHPLFVAWSLLFIMLVYI